jgi:hypothetical protein
LDEEATANLSSRLNNAQRPKAQYMRIEAGGAKALPRGTATKQKCEGTRTKDEMRVLQIHADIPVLIYHRIQD